MSNLAAYRTEHGISQAQFAARVGVNQSIISKIERGAARPGLDLAARIERETGGAVPAISWVPAALEPPAGAPTREDAA